jgi:phage major head subunit gpT-like protein
MALINSSSLAALRSQINGIFDDAYKGVSQTDLWYKMIAQEVPSNTTSVTYYLNQTLPRLRAWTGPRVENNIKRNGFAVTNVDYEDTVAVDINDIEDDNAGLYSTMFEALGRASAMWPNDLVYNAISAGSTDACIDGQPFFNGSHPLEIPGAPTTQSNLHTSTALTAANFSTIRLRMKMLKGEDGKPLGVGRKLVLVVPTELEDTARRIVLADSVGYLSNSSSTAADSNINKGMAELLVIPELSALSATTWYLMDVGQVLKPFIVQIRKSPNQVIAKDKLDDESVFAERTAKFGVHGRGAGTYGLWQLAHKCEA